MSLLGGAWFCGDSQAPVRGPQSGLWARFFLTHDLRMVFMFFRGCEGEGAGRRERKRGAEPTKSRAFAVWPFTGSRLVLMTLNPGDSHACNGLHVGLLSL